MSRNTSVPESDLSKASVKDVEDVNEQGRRVQIGMPFPSSFPRILELNMAADGPRLESIEVEIVDWDGSYDPENPLVH